MSAHSCTGLSTKMRWEQGRTIIVDCSSHANKLKMKRGFWSQAKGPLGAVEHGRRYLAVSGLPSRQRYIVVSIWSAQHRTVGFRPG